LNYATILSAEDVLLKVLIHLEMSAVLTFNSVRNIHAGCRVWTNQ